MPVITNLIETYLVSKDYGIDGDKQRFCCSMNYDNVRETVKELYIPTVWVA